MFPWDRKSHDIYGRKNGYRANSTVERRDPDYLPAIDRRHRQSREKASSYLGPNSEEFQEFQDMQRADTSYMNIKNERGGEQKKTYAKILEEQIFSRNAKKQQEKQRNLDLDKRMLEGGDFYKYFGQNHLEEKYRRQALLPSLETTTKNRYLDPRENVAYDGKNTPLKDERNSSFVEYGAPNQSGVKYIDERGESIDHKTKEYLKKIEYKQALEQQILELKLKKKHENDMRALEDRLDELKHSYVRLKTKPGKDGLSSEKLQGVPVMINGSEVLLKPVEPYRSERSSSMTRRPSYSKKYTPTHEILLAPDRNNRLKPIIKARGDKQSFDYSNDLNATLLDPKAVYVDEALISNYFQVQNELERTKNDIRDHMSKMNDKLADLRSELAHHSKATRDRNLLELQVIQDNPKHLASPYNVTDYLAIPQMDSQGPLLDPSESRHSLTHETQFVPVTDTSMGRGYISSPVVAAVPNYNPLIDNLATLTKKIDQSVQDQQQKFDRDLALIQQELRLFKKNEEEMQMEKLNEYVSFVGNFVGSTRKLEKSLNAQQQRLNREIGVIQEELRSFKANEQDFHLRKYNEYAPLVEDMVTLTKKLERTLNNQQNKLNSELINIQGELRSLKMRDEPKVFVPIQPSPIKIENPIEKIDRGYNLHENLASVGNRYSANGYQNGGGDLTKGKVRNKSQALKHNKRGVKRVREELPGEAQQRV